MSSFSFVSVFVTVSISLGVVCVSGQTHIVNLQVGQSLNETCATRSCSSAAAICHGREWTFLEASTNHSRLVDKCTDRTDRCILYVTSASQGTYTCTEYIRDPAEKDPDVIKRVIIKGLEPMPTVETTSVSSTTAAETKQPPTTNGIDSEMVSTSATIEYSSALSSDNSKAVVTAVVVSLCILFAIIVIIGVILWRRTRRFKLSNQCGAGLSVADVPIHEKWEFSRNLICLREEIGQGFYGTIYKAHAYEIISPQTWTTVAVKVLTKHEDEEETSLQAEARLFIALGNSKHENVVSLLGICSKQGPLSLIFEYAANGNLKSFLRSLRQSQSNEDCLSNTQTRNIEVKGISQQKMVKLALQIASGMKFLISKNILHCDLAARNVLVFDGEQLKLCDFGMSKDVTYHGYYRRKSKRMLPAKWMSPEAMIDKCYTQASDVWSFGVLLWEIGSLGGSPYPSVPVERLYDLLVGGYRMSCPAACPRRLHDIMLLCWASDPNERPSFETLFERLVNMHGE